MHFDLCEEHAGPGEGGCPFCSFESYEARIAELQTKLTESNINWAEQVAIVSRLEGFLPAQVLDVLDMNRRLQAQIDAVQAAFIPGKDGGDVLVAIYRILHPN